MKDDANSTFKTVNKKIHPFQVYISNKNYFQFHDQYIKTLLIDDSTSLDIRSKHIQKSRQIHTKSHVRYFDFKWKQECIYIAFGGYCNGLSQNKHHNVFIIYELILNFKGQLFLDIIELTVFKYN